MIKSVTITNALSESLTMDLGSPEKSGFSILQIEGLGPPKANINIKDMATSDGALFNSARVLSRNIVFTLGFMDVVTQTIEDIRRASYRYFPVKGNVSILFVTDTRTQKISGWIESNEPDIFSDNEGTVISIICPNPYFYSEEITTTSFSGTTGGFTFPFANNSLVSKLLIFSNIFFADEKSVYYTGDAPIGVVVYIHFIATVVNPIVYNSRTLEAITINTTKLTAMIGTGIIAGDDIIITTIKGQKGVILLRAGVETNILNALDQGASWFSLLYGDNLYKYDAASGKPFMQVKIENQTIYQGI